MSPAAAAAVVGDVVDGAALLGGVGAMGTDADGTVVVVVDFEWLLQAAPSSATAQIEATTHARVWRLRRGRVSSLGPTLGGVRRGTRAR